jgi:DNA uptake protein ComE-like DNA-binding protein
VIRSIFSRTPLALSGLVLCLIANGCTSEPTPEAPKPEAAKTTTTETKPAKSSKIDINTAPIAELDKLELPGTKPSLSERIQGGRPYKQIDDLVSKKVISAEEFKLIQNLVTTETKK